MKIQIRYLATDGTIVETTYKTDNFSDPVFVEYIKWKEDLGAKILWLKRVED